MNTNLDTNQNRKALLLFINRYVPKVELFVALVLTVATQCIIFIQFPPNNPSFLKDICAHIATISANLWAIMLAALVIVIPHIDKERHGDTLKHFATIMPTLFLCIVLASTIYFYAALQQEIGLLAVLVLFPVTCLFYYSINIAFTATVQILKGYFKFPIVAWFFVSRKK